MSDYLDQDFLLTGETARHLYHQAAAQEPILDYHTHLSPREICENHRWQNPTDIWLRHDHYKWRAMRANGIPESHITGNATDREKFEAWAATVPHTLRNPLYDWTHLELRRAFGIDLLLSPETAETIWGQASERMQQDDFSAQGLLARFHVAAVGTTDDPSDDLAHHTAHNASDPATKVYPTFRPDKALTVCQPLIFRQWVTEMATTVGRDIPDVETLIEALGERHRFFHQRGARLSDHGLPSLHGRPCSYSDANRIFQAALAGVAASQADSAAFTTLIMQSVARWNAENDWTMQLHLNARRNPNSRFHQQLGADSGFDTIGDSSQEGILQFLDLLDSEQMLPKTILYTLNPRDNPFLAAAASSFCEGPVPGKVQLGAAWWFNDSRQGILAHLETIATLGLLSHFVGFLTDSRSFLSYPRHEYFRRILCELIGAEVDQGKLPRDIPLLETLVRNLSYRNCQRYLALPDPALSTAHPS